MRKTTVDTFQAIADPGRRQILMLLSTEKLSINALADNFEISRPAVSKHIKILYKAGFITINDVGRERYCELNPQGFEEIKNWITYFESFWNNKLMKLEKLLDSTATKPKKK